MYFVMSCEITIYNCCILISKKNGHLIKNICKFDLVIDFNVLIWNSDYDQR